MKYDLFQCFKSWFDSSTFPTFTDWKIVVRHMTQVFETDAWSLFCNSRPDMHGAQTCFGKHLSKSWSITDEYPDQVTRLHMQAKFMDNFRLNVSVACLKDVESALCFICKKDIEN